MKMNQILIGRVRWVVVCVCSLFLMLLFAACGSVSGTGASAGTITGSIVSVNSANHSVTINVNEQQLTVSGLTDQELSQLQGTVGKTWSFQVTGDNGSYQLSSGTNPQEDDFGTSQVNGTPEPNETPDVNNETQGAAVSEPASIDFTGRGQSVNANSIAVKMPNGDVLSMSINNLTDREDFGTGLPATGQMVKVKAIANADGSFTAEKLEMVDSGDQADWTDLNTVDVQGITTSAVGSGNVLHLRAGNKNFTATLASTTQVEGFTSAQNIASGQSIKADILFNGSSATLVKIDNGND
jgi:hypothetical protein